MLRAAANNNILNGLLIAGFFLSVSVVVFFATGRLMVSLPFSAWAAILIVRGLTQRNATKRAEMEVSKTPPPFGSAS
jgi:hypothetical protein